MKKKFIVIISLIVIVALFLFFYSFYSEKEHSDSQYSLSQKEINLLQEGDIILRHGFGLVSDIIVKSLKEKYDVSHCGIICKNNKGKINVIHSVSQTLSDVDGIQLHEINRFVKDSRENSIIVVRYKLPFKKSQSCISEKAKYYLAKEIPFDNSFDIEDSSEFYCSELLWKIILIEYEKDIFKYELAEKNEHLKLKVFWDTAYFDVIINHHLRRKNLKEI